MLRDILGLILSFSVENNQFQWLTVCKEWNKVGTDSEVFKKERSIYDLTEFIKSMTMVPQNKAGIVMDFGEGKIDIRYDHVDTIGDYWFIERKPGTNIKYPNGIMEGIFEEPQHLIKIIDSILRKYTQITIIFPKIKIALITTGYKLLDDLLFNGYISTSKGDDRSIMNLDSIRKHHERNREMYPRFTRECLEISETLKDRKYKHQGQKLGEKSKCIIV